MVRLKGSKGTGKASLKNVKGQKRKAESALENETGEDEFFLASDQEDNVNEDEEALEETAEHKRLRLGMLNPLKALHVGSAGWGTSIETFPDLWCYGAAAKAYIARMRQGEPLGGRPLSSLS